MGAQGARGKQKNIRNKQKHNEHDQGLNRN